MNEAWSHGYTGKKLSRMISTFVKDAFCGAELSEKAINMFMHIGH